MDIGNYEFIALIPFQAKEFTDEDWIKEGCNQIEADILNDGNSFMSFTKNLILELLDQEVDILTFLGYS